MPTEMWRDNTLDARDNPKLAWAENDHVNFSSLTGNPDAISTVATSKKCSCYHLDLYENQMLNSGSWNRRFLALKHRSLLFLLLLRRRRSRQRAQVKRGQCPPSQCSGAAQRRRRRSQEERCSAASFSRRRRVRSETLRETGDRRASGEGGSGAGPGQARFPSAFRAWGNSRCYQCTMMACDGGKRTIRFTSPRSLIPEQEVNGRTSERLGQCYPEMKSPEFAKESTTSAHIKNIMFPLPTYQIHHFNIF